MSASIKEVTPGAVREIEPELRELFTKVVERDPREAVVVYATSHDQWWRTTLTELH